MTANPMTIDRTALLALADKVEAATEPDRELGGLITAALAPPKPAVDSAGE